MYILTISECYPSKEKQQNGIFIKQQIDELKSHGHKVDVLIPARNGKNKGLYSIEELGDTRWYIGYNANRYDLFPKMWAKECYIQLKKHISNQGYDLITVHITGDVILKIVVDIANELSIPIVIHYHGLNVWCDYVTRHPSRQRFYAKRRERILGRTSVIVGVSKKVQDVICERIQSVPVYTVYNGVDLEKFKPEIKKETDQVSIVAVGNLIQTKGFRYLIESFAKLYAGRQDIHLDILGEGPEKKQLIERAYQLNIENAISFHGKLEYEQVAEYMKKGYMFVLPSYYEALGCVYLEAMACGLPTIGVRGMGIDEIIVDGDNGFLVEPQDTDELYEKMSLLLESSDLAIKIGERARKTMIDYSWKISGEVLNEIYSKCVTK